MILSLLYYFTLHCSEGKSDSQFYEAFCLLVQAKLALSFFSQACMLYMCLLCPWFLSKLLQIVTTVVATIFPQAKIVYFRLRMPMLQIHILFI